jgi:2-oxoglutarate ferredoxin oxidoreductase subunit alpha
MERSVNILIGGEAGQGLVTIGQLLSKTLVRCGYRIVVTQSYQSRIRGGHNAFAVRVAAGEIEAPAESIDLLIALDGETVRLHLDELAEGGLALTDERLEIEDGRCFGVPYEKLATDDRFINTTAFGSAAALLGLDLDVAEAVLDALFGKKHPEMAEGNVNSLRNGYRWAEDNAGSSHRLAPIEDPGDRVMLNGNEAIAFGAASAGARFCSFYPMTPATSVPLTLIGIAERMGLVVEQVEDEIAAVNMAIGASYAGVPSLVSTSGGGFALMVEGISLAGMTETPLVVVIAQRPGPATGLPTRTEQADLGFALHAGHGEFPRAIFAPGSIEECFHLTRRAFDLAERYQGPVFVLTDQFLADSYRAVEAFDVGTLDSVRPGADPGEVEVPYLRHRITDSGVSPRLLPGASRHLVVTDSDEHTEDGHLTEDLGERILQVEKRLRKGYGLIDEALTPEPLGDEDPDLLFVSWGSTRGSVLEAAASLRADGMRVAVLHFSQTWPLVPEDFLPVLEGAKRVVAVEGNAFGQFAGLLRLVSGFEIEGRISRYDGLPITPEYILRKVE